MSELQFSPLSLASYYVSLRFNQTELSFATAFFIRRNSKCYLVTNWHVLSGRNPNNGACLSDTYGVPNNILVRAHTNNEFINFLDFEIPLLNSDDTPRWLEHPKFKEKVDVVALEVCLPPEQYIVHDIEQFIEPFNEGTIECVADDVFVIGYPLGLSAGGLFPIWKRASIASEPIIDIDGLPKLLIDTASRKGMSGSPVMLYRKRPVLITNGKPEESGAQISRFFMKLVGVYSGRVGVCPGNKNIEAQLGTVWKSSVINEIIDQKT